MIVHEAGHCYESSTAANKPAKHNKIWGYIEDPSTNTFVTFWGRVDGAVSLKEIGKGPSARLECEKLWREKSRKYRPLDKNEYRFYIPNYETLINS